MGLRRNCDVLACPVNVSPFNVYDLLNVRQAFGQGSGAILSYHRILSRWDRRIHHCYLHDEHCWPICCFVSPLLERLDDIDRLLRCGICRFLMAQSYAGFVCQYAWISGSFPRPPSKRAVALALINAFSQLGNIAGSCVELPLEKMELC